jgi:hypothetical protein
MQHIVATCFAQQQEERYTTAQGIAFGGEYIRMPSLFLIDELLQQIHLSVYAAYSSFVIRYE